MTAKDSVDTATEHVTRAQDALRQALKDPSLTGEQRQRVIHAIASTTHLGWQLEKAIDPKAPFAGLIQATPTPRKKVREK
jgi:hypothetical protein